ncbi:LCP family protein [Citricoccus nitrophenolicus]|uniref:LytR family transcriptional attenuator n=1 Tax=Citricoccus muralis TaxID=169134 RepID=A0A3D9L8R9_9MICC|nr:LCP family protein [Citricoccus muralis]REE02751.1 LytR family transcriptional attenuator [Citricoccus muralis]
MSHTENNDYLPRRSSGRARRRRHTVRNAFIVVAALLVVVLVFVGIYVGSIASTFNDKRQTVDAGIATSEATTDGALNVLVMGSDSRGEGMDTAENKGEEGERSDTLMLVHIPEDRQNVYVMSVVRDLWVEIPGHGERKVNAALGLGGYPLVTATVENLLGVNIDHLAVIDFEGFNGLTSALGGVQVCNPHSFSSGQVNPSFFPQGEILLQGSDALRFVRERKAFAGGDFERVANQQRFVSAMVDQILTVDTLANPQKLMGVVNSIVPFITVDDGLDAATIAGYGLQLNGIRSNDIETFTVPHGDPAEGPGGASIVLQDESGVEELRQALQTDDLDSYLSGDDDTEGAAGDDATAGATDAATDGGATPDASADASGEPSDSSASSASGEPSATDGGTDASNSASGSASGSGGASGEATEPAAVCAGA